MSETPETEPAPDPREDMYFSGRIWEIGDELQRQLYKYLPDPSDPEGTKHFGGTTEVLRSEKELQALVCIGARIAMIAAQAMSMKKTGETMVCPWEIKENQEPFGSFTVRGVALDYERGDLGYVEVGMPKQLLAEGSYEPDNTNPICPRGAQSHHPA